MAFPPSYPDYQFDFSPPKQQQQQQQPSSAPLTDPWALPAPSYTPDFPSSPTRGQPQQSLPNGASSKGGTALSKTNIYLSGLKPSTTDEDLKALCQCYGKIVSAKAIVDRELNFCKGYGFVMFELETAAKAAVDALTRSGAQAAFAKVTRAQLEYQGRQEADPTNLYITNLPRDMDEPQLASMLVASLESMGNVVSCRILRDTSGFSRGVGLARMDSHRSCQTAIRRLNGRVLRGGFEPLKIKFANGPSPKKAKFLQREHGKDRGPTVDPVLAAAVFQNFPVPRARSNSMPAQPSSYGAMQFPGSRSKGARPHVPFFSNSNGSDFSGSPSQHHQPQQHQPPLSHGSDQLFEGSHRRSLSDYQLPPENDGYYYQDQRSPHSPTTSSTDSPLTPATRSGRASSFTCSSPTTSPISRLAQWVPGALTLEEQQQQLLQQQQQPHAQSAEALFADSYASSRGEQPSLHHRHQQAQQQLHHSHQPPQHQHQHQQQQQQQQQHHHHHHHAHQQQRFVAAEPDMYEHRGYYPSDVPSELDKYLEPDHGPVPSAYNRPASASAAPAFGGLDFMQPAVPFGSQAPSGVPSSTPSF